MKIGEQQKMTNNELDQIVGGCTYECVNDSKFLNALLRGTEFYQCERVGRAKILIGHGFVEDVERSWNSIGVEVVSDRTFDANVYKINGKVVSRDEAWEYAQNKVGKHLDRKDWDW